jgi:hypothetical protein
LDCRRYDRDGKLIGAAAGKPSASESKKPYKKFGGHKSIVFMQTILEAYVMAKKSGKSKKHKKNNITTPVAVPTVNRKVGAMTGVLV